MFSRVKDKKILGIALILTCLFFGMVIALYPGDIYTETDWETYTTEEDETDTESPVYSIANYNITTIPKLRIDHKYFWLDPGWETANPYISGWEGCSKEYNLAFQLNILKLESLNQLALVTSDDTKIKKFETDTGIDVSSYLDRMHSALTEMKSYTYSCSVLFERRATSWIHEYLVTYTQNVVPDIIPGVQGQFLNVRCSHNIVTHEECESDDDGGVVCKLVFDYLEETCTPSGQFPLDYNYTAITRRDYQPCWVKDYCDGSTAWWVGSCPIYAIFNDLKCFLGLGESWECVEIDSNGYGACFKSSMTYAANALVEAEEVNNVVVERINEEIKNLDMMGADYEGYHGDAKGVWVNASRIGGAVLFQNATGKNLEYDDFTTYYSDAQYITNAIVLESFKYPKKTEFYLASAYSNVMDYLVGKGSSSLLEGIDLYYALVEANRTMHNEYIGANEYAKDALDALTEKISMLNDEKLYLIDEEIPMDVYVEEYTETIGGAGITGYTISDKYNDLVKQAENINKTYNKAVKLSTSHYKDNYLSTAIEMMEDVEQNATELENNADSLYDEALNYLDNIRTLATEKTEECRLLIEESNNVERNAYGLQFLHEAQAAVSTEQNIGSQYKGYLEAYKKAAACVAVMTGNETVPMVDVQNLLQKYLNTINCVERQGYSDIANEHMELYNYYSKLDISDSDAVLIDLESEIESLIDDLYTDIGEEFDDIYTAKSEAARLLSYMEKYGIDIMSEKGTFNRLDRYFTGGKLNMERAVCDLADIRNDYNNLVNSLKSKSSSAISEILAANYEVYVDYSATPVIDEILDVEITVILTNPTPLETSTSISVSIPLDFVVYKKDAKEIPSDVKNIVSNGNTLTITFYEIEPNKQYKLVFDISGIFFKKTASSEKINRKDIQLTSYKRTMKFNAIIPSEMVWDVETIPKWTVGGSAKLDGRSVKAELYSGTAKLFLSDVSEGLHTVEFTYIIENRNVSVNATKDAYYRELDITRQNLEELNNTIQSLIDNGMYDDAYSLQEQYNAAKQLYDDAVGYARAGDWGNALDKLREAKEAALTDINSIILNKRKELLDRYAKLSSVWTQMDIEDANVTALKDSIEEKLQLLRSVDISPEDLGMIDDISSMLDMFESKINEHLEKNAQKFFDGFYEFKKILNDFENNVLPSYRESYETLRNFKVGGVKIIVFPFTLTQINERVRDVKRTVEDIDKVGKNITTELVASFDEAKDSFEAMNKKITDVLTNVRNRTVRYIEGSRKSIEVLEQKKLPNEQKTKFVDLKTQVMEAEQLLQQGRIPQAFMKSAVTYTDLLMMLSTLPEDGGMDIVQVLIILLSLVFIGVIGYVVYTGIKQQKPVGRWQGFDVLKRKRKEKKGKEKLEQKPRGLGLWKKKKAEPEEGKVPMRKLKRIAVRKFARKKR